VSACLSFADDPGYVNAVCEKIKADIAAFKPDHLLLSYHGLPVRHVKKISASCEGNGQCSLAATSSNQLCYRRQAYLTSEMIKARLANVWPAEKISVGFQSRLNSKWIQPFSDEFYRQLPKQGVRRLLVACPSFVADCLETLEEVAMRGRAEFVLNGGEDLRLVPCVNESDAWVGAARDIVSAAKYWTPLG
jgi:ferrochelatase